MTLREISFPQTGNLSALLSLSPEFQTKTTKYSDALSGKSMHLQTHVIQLNDSLFNLFLDGPLGIQTGETGRFLFDKSRCRIPDVCI